MKFRLSILVFFFALNGQAQNKQELNQLQSLGKLNLVPMYGSPHIAKDLKYLEIDEKFIEIIDKDFSSKDIASKELVHYGFNYFFKGQLQTAMKRFNQSWLLDTTNAGSYFGFWLVQSVLEVPSVRNQFFDLDDLSINKVFSADKYYEIGKEYDSNNEYEKIALDYACSSFADFGATEKGIANCFKKLNYNASDTLAFQNLSNNYMEMKEWEKALEIQFQSLNYRKDKGLVYNDIAWSYEKLGMSDSAITYYLKSIDNSKNTYFKPRLNYCILKEKIGNCENTIHIIDQCIHELPKERFFYLIKGRLQLCQDQKEEAIKTLKKAKKLGSKEAHEILRKI